MESTDLAPIVLFDEIQSDPTGSALSRALRALLVEHRMPYTAHVALDRLLRRIGFTHRTIEAAGYRVTCRRGTIDELIVESVLTNDEYFWRHPDYRPERGQTVIDVGGNIGTFALAAAKYVGPSGRIISIEPHPDNVRYFERNIKQNGITTVALIPGAVAARNGVVTIFASEHSGLHSMRIDHGRGSFCAEAFTLEELMERHRIERCDLLKIDCEGGEFDIVPAVKAETWRRIRRVAMEYSVPLNNWSYGHPTPEHAALKRSMSADLVRILRENDFRIDGYYDADGHRSGYIFGIRPD